MKENKDKLDQLIGEAFSGFEESPPEAVKSSVFKRMLYFNVWHSIRKYLLIGILLLLAVGAVYFMGVFSSAPGVTKVSETTLAEKQNISSAEPQNYGISNKSRVSVTNTPEEKRPVQNIKGQLPYAGKHKANVPATNQTQSVNNTSLQIQKQSFSPVNNNNKPPQYDVTTTSQNNILISQNKQIANNQITTDMMVVDENVPTVQKDYIEIPQHDSVVERLSETNKDIQTEKPENVFQKTSDNKNSSEKKKTSLLWSAGINIGHSLLQSDLIKTSEQVSDALPVINKKMGFPSGFAGLSVRAEKKNFFFEFGLQYASLSERLSSDRLLYNAQPYQNISLSGQNMIIDTSGYWHYFYLSTTTISIVDSIWTLRNDTTLINLYDTTWLQRYDTLKNPSWVNTYSRFELPVYAGWMKNFGKLHLGFSTGPIFSFLVGTKGKMPYRINNGTELITTNSEFKPLLFGISWQITGILNYQFTTRMVLELMPYYRRTVLPFKSNESKAVLRDNSFGLQFGLRYYF